MISQNTEGKLLAADEFTDTAESLAKLNIRNATPKITVEKINSDLSPSPNENSNFSHDEILNSLEEIDDQPSEGANTLSTSIFKNVIARTLIIVLLFWWNSANIWLMQRMNPIAVPVEVLRKREKKWLNMFNSWPQFMEKQFDKIKQRCRKGIPPAVRATAWKYLCGAQHCMTNPNMMHLFDMLNRLPGDQKWNDDIKKDLSRQFPNHELFARNGFYKKTGQKDLYYLLKAWTVLHPEEGYCQGQAPVAATLLMQMPLKDAFYCFIQICEKYLPGYYSPGLEAIQLDGDILFALLKKHCYVGYKHLKNQHIDPVLYMVEWFMCIYCRTLPWSTVLRVWDMFFCEGVKVLFKVAIVLFRCALGSNQQLQRCPTMYETVERLRKLPPQIMQEEFLIQKVVALHLSDEELERVHCKVIKERKFKQKTKLA
ncbi:putative TBC domain protein [Trichinella nativa]|uniref:Putative TBC domain protein n=1 Tax=Trichinella nativa TaxID=6335 RepID=A0A1Y3E856_9BILA|nr:putative TBC domain protein [Trichinella nativa]